MSTDIALIWNQDRLTTDIAVARGDLVTDAGLETAFTVSLLTDRLAEPGDVIPDGSDRRGWWGDAGEQYPIGSRLWLLSRAVLTQATLNAARDYALEALQWAVDDGVVGALDVVASVAGLHRINLEIAYFQAGASKTFNVVWDAQAAAVTSQT